MYPDVSLKQAREKCEEVRKLVAAGNDPSAARQAEKRAVREAAANDFEAVPRDWLDNKELVPVPIGKIADRAMEFIRAHKDEPSVIGMWQSKNRHGLREFWANSPNDALAVKTEVERAFAGGGAQE